MTVLLPAYLQGAVYGALEDRQVISATYAPGSYDGSVTTVRSGVLPGHLNVAPNALTLSPPELRVEQLTPASMSLKVNAGHAVIQGVNSTTQGVYLIKNDSAISVEVQVADNTSPRIDLVVLEVLDQAYAGTLSTGRIRVVQGTASLTPVVPTITGNFLVLCQISVPARSTALTSNMLIDRRQFTAVRGEQIVCTSQTRPVPFLRARIYELDSGRDRVWANTGWIIDSNLELTGTRSYNFQNLTPGTYFQDATPIVRFAANTFAAGQDVSMTTTYWMLYAGASQQNFWPRLVLSYNIPVNQFIVDHRQLGASSGYSVISVTQQSYFTMPADYAGVPVEVFVGVQAGTGGDNVILGNAYFTARPVHR